MNLAFSSHRDITQYKIHIKLSNAIQEIKNKTTDETFLWSKLCAHTFWRSISNSILESINQNLTDNIYYHFHWTIMFVIE